MKVLCTADIDYFTNGKVYDVIRIDKDGDYWTIDDEDESMFLTPEECTVFEGDITNDIRIIAKTVDGKERYSIGRVVYKEDGNIFFAENPYSTYATLEEAYGFLDQMYKASLKPVLVVNADGSYE